MIGEYFRLLAPAPHRMDGQLEKELMGKKMDRIPFFRLEKMVDSDLEMRPEMGLYLHSLMPAGLVPLLGIYPREFD